MIDRQMDYAQEDTPPKVTVSTDQYGHLHIMIGHDQLDDLVALLRQHRIVHNVQQNAGPAFANVEIGGDITADALQKLLDSVD